MDEIGSGPRDEGFEPGGPSWGAPAGDPFARPSEGSPAPSGGTSPYGDPFGAPAAGSPGYGEPFGPPTGTPLPGSAAVPAAAAGGSWTRHRLVKVGAFVAAGVIAAAVGISALQHDDATATAGSGATAQGSTTPGPSDDGNVGGNGNGNFGGGFGGAFGGGGGVAGETRIIGTVSAVGGSSVSVTARDGSKATYTVTSDTEILRDGAVAPLSALKAGDPVLVHVLPDGGQGTAERILAGTFTGSRGGPPPGVYGQAPDGTLPDQTTPATPTTPGQTGVGTTTTTVT